MQHSPSLLSSIDACCHIRNHFSWEQEEVHIIALNPQKQVLATGLLFRGTVDYCLFHPRDVFRFLLKHNASCFILAHNHPSGEQEPSGADIEVTRRLYKLAIMMQIELLDHLILTPTAFCSLKEKGALRLSRSTRARLK